MDSTPSDSNSSKCFSWELPHVPLVFQDVSPIVISSPHPRGIFDSQPAHVFLGIVGLLALVPLVVYTTTWTSFTLHRLSWKDGRSPPIVPYTLPFIGSALSFVLDPGRCLSAAAEFMRPQAVYGLKMLKHRVYLLHGPNNVAPIWKYKRTITTPNVQTFVIRSLFAMSDKAIDMYTQDNSGIQPKPEPDSTVAPHNRIDYLTHETFHRLLNGEGLPGLYKRWSASFMLRLASIGLSNAWTDTADIVDFWMPPLTAALNEAIAGPILERRNQNFTREFLDYLPYVNGLMRGLPKFLLPKAYALRDSLLLDVKEWQAIARAKFNERDVDEDGDSDPWWGSKSIRERQRFLGNVDNWDHDSVASSDFGFLWGANINVHTAAIWTIIEVFRDKELLSRVRAELNAAGFAGITTDHDIDRLLRLPLLQSVYAEVLRLRVETQSVFWSEREEIRINQWRFPKKSVLLVPTGPAHRDEGFWNTRDGERPLNKFWADRFLVYANDPRSGPRKKTAAQKDEVIVYESKSAAATDGPRFVSSGLSNSFMPYGIGERVCPGQFFARREIIAFCAQIVATFDIDILSVKEDFRMGPAFYGWGTQRALDKIPARIRWRE